MPTKSKIFVALFLILLGGILGGLYGILHDQITYSISKEYYTKFKFIQFGILNNFNLRGADIGTLKAPEIILQNPRFGASIVGFLATWWVGLIIGTAISLAGLVHKNASIMFRVSLRALLLTLIIALGVGLFGLLYAKLFLMDPLPHWHIPDNVLDPRAFVSVGSMHNFSYLGGAIGLIVGVFYSFRKYKEETTP